MSFVEVQQAFADGRIYKATIPTLYECLKAVLEQPPYVDPRHQEFANTIRNLINERENRARHDLAILQAKDLHQQISQQAETHHRETQGQWQTVSKDLETVKDEVSDIKGTLEDTHRIHLWTFWVAVVTAILAGVASWEVIGKWFPNKPSVVVSEPTQSAPGRSTNR